jgi:hypothetical protein
MASENTLDRRREPERRWFTDAFALAAERLLEITPGLKIDANSRRNKLHRFDRTPFGHRQEMFTPYIVTQ